MQNATPTTTTLLLSRLRDSRDEDAWRQFDTRFRGVILSTGTRLGLDRPDAEEVAQEVMLQAFRDYMEGKYDRSKGRLSSWIVAIAHHRIIDVLRKRRRRMTGGKFDEEGHSIQESEVADAFEQSLERQIFEQAWDMLREQSKIDEKTLRAFELTSLRGVPPSEAAAQCQMSVNQVYVARSRVAKVLKETVEKLDRAVRNGL